MAGSSGSTVTEREVQTAFFRGLPGENVFCGLELNRVIRIHIVIVNASAGTVQLQANNSGGSRTVTIKTNSDLVARRSS